MRTECQFCHVLRFISKRTTVSTVSSLHFSECCREGLELFAPPQTSPPLHIHLLTTPESTNRTSCTNIFAYNNSLGMPCAKANWLSCGSVILQFDPAMTEGGRIYDFLGTKIPPSNSPPFFTP